MIIKRLVEGIKNQDWFTVMIEVMIVVVGVYLGIFIGETASERALKKDAYISLELLAVTLREDLAQLDAVLVEQQSVADKYNEAVNALKSAPLDFDVANTALKVLITMETPNFYPNRSTYQIMLSGGQMEALDNLELRQKITKLYEYSFTRNVEYSTSFATNTDETYRDITAYHYDLSTGQLISKSEDELTRLRSGLYNQALYGDAFVGFMKTFIKEPMVEVLHDIEADIAMRSNEGKK
jgi:hypothetical protein